MMMQFLHFHFLLFFTVWPQVKDLDGRRRRRSERLKAAGGDQLQDSKLFWPRRSGKSFDIRVQQVMAFTLKEWISA